jgi:protein FAM32A
MSDAFANVIGGGLKLKGSLAPAGGVKKKKKDKEQGKATAGGALALASEAGALGDADAGAPAARTGPDRRTEAERRHDERVAKEEKRLIAKMAAKTHREKVQEFNAYLAKLSEHHDIPRVGPG